MKAKNIIIMYYVFSSLFSACIGFNMAVYSNFLRSANLDEFWVNMVNAYYFITIVLSEIPTGIYADLYGRKSSFIISCFIGSISKIIYGLSGSFRGFVIAEVISAIGRTFCTGAFDSWFVDSIEATGEK